MATKDASLDFINETEEHGYLAVFKKNNAKRILRFSFYFAVIVLGGSCSGIIDLSESTQLSPLSSVINAFSVDYYAR